MWTHCSPRLHFTCPQLLWHLAPENPCGNREQMRMEGRLRRARPVSLLTPRPHLREVQARHGLRSLQAASWPHSKKRPLQVHLQARAKGSMGVVDSTKVRDHVQIGAQVRVGQDAGDTVSLSTFSNRPYGSHGTALSEREPRMESSGETNSPVVHPSLPAKPRPSTAQASPWCPHTGSLLQGGSASGSGRVCTANGQRQASPVRQQPAPTWPLLRSARRGAVPTSLAPAGQQD